MQTQQITTKSMAGKQDGRAMKKIVRIGSIPDYNNRQMNIFCKIEFKDGRLSISGVEGPMSDGNARGSCGQIDMHLRDQVMKISPGKGWDRRRLREFFKVWKLWHLNDLRAGSPEQEEWLKDNPIPEAEYAYPKSHYVVASQKLADAGLNPDSEGYMYGHAWKFEAVPDDVLAFLESLPETDKTPAWV